MVCSQSVHCHAVYDTPTWRLSGGGLLMRASNPLLSRYDAISMGAFFFQMTSGAITARALHRSEHCEALLFRPHHGGRGGLVPSAYVEPERMRALKVCTRPWSEPARAVRSAGCGFLRLMGSIGQACRKNELREAPGSCNMCSDPPQTGHSDALIRPRSHACVRNF